MYDGQTGSDADSGPAPVFDYGARKRRIVFALLAYSAVLGMVVDPFAEEDVALDFILSMPFLILAVAWCFTDAYGRGHRIGRVMGVLLIGFFLAGFPIYLFQTRGMGAFKTLAWTVLLIAGMAACMVATALARWCLEDVTGLW